MGVENQNLSSSFKIFAHLTLFSGWIFYEPKISDFETQTPHVSRCNFDVLLVIWNYKQFQLLKSLGFTALLKKWILVFRYNLLNLTFLLILFFTALKMYFFVFFSSFQFFILINFILWVFMFNKFNMKLFRTSIEFLFLIYRTIKINKRRNYYIENQ